MHWQPPSAELWFPGRWCITCETGLRFAELSGHKADQTSREPAIAVNMRCMIEAPVSPVHQESVLGRLVASAELCFVKLPWSVAMNLHLPPLSGARNGAGSTVPSQGIRLLLTGRDLPETGSKFPFS